MSDWVVDSSADEPLYRAVHTDYPAVVLLRDW
jgi:hypothetical protein